MLLPWESLFWDFLTWSVPLVGGFNTKHQNVIYKIFKHKKDNYRLLAWIFQKPCKTNQLINSWNILKPPMLPYVLGLRFAEADINDIDDVS